MVETLERELENPGLPASACRIADVINRSVSAIAKHLRRRREHAFRLVSREHIFSLADQAVVSGTSFLTTIFIARWSDLSQLGIYAFGLSLLMSLLGFQDSLILQPYLIKKYRPEGIPAERAGSSLTISFLFSALSMLVLTVGGLGFLEWGGGSGLVVVILAIAGIVPFVMARDFVRRFAFAHLELGRAFFLDLAAAIIQLSALGWLGMNGRMSAAGACAALGAASAFPTIIWLCYARAEFTVRVRHVRTALKETWALGKWLLAGRITVQVQGYAIYWISMVIGGAVVTGGYAACMSIVGFANPLLTGLSNVLMPRSVLAWKDGGGPSLWHEATRNAVLIAALVLPFTLAVLLAGESVMRFLYHGGEFEDLSHTLTVLAAAMAAGALGFPASNALAVMERPRAIVTVGILGAVLTVVLTWVLMTKWGLLGAAYGLLVGGVAGSAGRWVAFVTRIPKVYDAKRVVQVLKHLTDVADESRWAITRIGEGDEAEVFIINSTDQEPIWRTHHTLVAKVYKPKDVSTLEEITLEKVQTQFNSLSDRHAVLDGGRINGWRISVPQPLYICKCPLALVMTAVPGQYIDSYASKSNVLTPEILHEAAQTVAVAMEECWSRGQPHGDFSLDNVLLDVERKEISFIDAGDAGVGHLYNDHAKQFVLASDLANFLNGVAMDVMDLNKNPTVRMNKELFAECVLLAIFERNNNFREESRRLLSEIWFCAQKQLADYVDLSWSPHGAWTRFVKLVAMHRIRSILQRIESQLNVCAGQDRYEFGRAVQLRGRS